MDFESVCMECIKNDEFVNEYCRLKGIKRPDRLSPLEEMIDKSCGYDSKSEFVKEFVATVFELVWMPLVEEADRKQKIQ